MARIVLKVDVDTWRGTREGVPALARLFERAGVPATFLFSLGPDHTGRAIRRAFRPGFVSKVRRTSVLEHYGWRTLLYGTLLPGPDIGRREAATLRAVERAGFEAGVHCWDHVRWQDHAAAADAAWTHTEMAREADRFAMIFGHAPQVRGAAGWQMNESAFRIEAELGYAIASDTRGRAPFQPVDDQGRAIGPVQAPTTLPTFDELIGADGCTAANVHDMLLARTDSDGAALHVYTLHAELEGQKLLPAFARLLEGWRGQGHDFATLGSLSALPTATLPRCRVGTGAVLGRSGTLALQR